MKVFAIISKLTVLGVLLDVIAIATFSALAGNASHARSAPPKRSQVQPAQQASSKSATIQPQ